MAFSELVTPAVLRLDLPASPQFLVTARLVAAAAGADAGMSIDDLDDLRLGVDELVAMMIERAGADARVHLEVAVAAGLVTIGGRVEGDVRPDAGEVDPLSERIVAAVADAYELGDRSFRLEKRAARP